MHGHCSADDGVVAAVALSTFSLGASSEGIPEEAFSLNRAGVRVSLSQVQAHFQLMAAGFKDLRS